jgi:hypothetical protein
MSAYCESLDRFLQIAIHSDNYKRPKNPADMGSDDGNDDNIDGELDE